MENLDVSRTSAAGRRDGPSLVWRILLVAAGAGLAVIGWTLVMTAILSFIGLPLFLFGVALMQSQEG